LLALTLAVPAFALEESDVEAAVSSSSREAVTGNVLVWFLCAVGFLKVSQKIDSFMASIGVNVGHTGGSMLGEAMVAFKGVSLATGMAGKVVGNFADRASSRAGAAASGSSGFLQGGLAGVVSRKITNDAVRTATQTTQKASSSITSAAHQATERTVNAERQAASVVHQAKQTRSESASQKSQTGVTHQQVASSTRTASVSSLHRESQHSVGLGGRIFTNSMLEGGRFANDVIGMVAAGDLHSTGSITGEFASQALSSYDVARPTTLTTGTYSARLNYRVLYKTNYNTSYQVLASNLLTSNNYSFSLNAIPMQAGEVVTDIYFDFGKVPVGFQSVVNPTLSVMVNGNAVNGYQMVNRADVGGKYQGTWQTATASWVTIIRRLWNTPTLPKTGY
jgi:hypothetical protein